MVSTVWSGCKHANNEADKTVTIYKHICKPYPIAPIEKLKEIS